MGRKKKKILIIEDEKALAEMYQERFIAEGFDVSLAFTAEEGLSLAKKRKPDLILLDILLPTQNGVSFLAKLRQDPKTKDITVVAFSNYDEPQTKEEALKLGAKAYLLKTSYTPKELVKEVKKYLSGKNQRRVIYKVAVFLLV